MHHIRSAASPAASRAARRRLRSAAAVAGAGAAALLLAGCADNTATTRNGVTPGPALPAGMSLPPAAVQFQVHTPSPTPSP